MSKAKKSRSNSSKVFRQHWIVWLLFTRPDEITVKKLRLYYEHRELIQVFNKDVVHPRESTTIRAYFPKSLLIMWVFILPWWILARLVGKKIPFGYRTVIISSETAENKITYMTNYQELIQSIINE